jgi:hypothetical protein
MLCFVFGSVMGQKTLIVNIVPSGSGTVTANGTPITSGVGKSFADTSVVPIAATPANGYGFLRWIINNTDRESDNPYNVSMSENKTITAQFGTSTCTSYTFEDVSTSDLSTGSYVNDDFTANGGVWSVLASELNAYTSYYAHAGTHSIYVKYGGALITPTLVRPVTLSFWAKMYNTSYSSTVKVYISTDGGKNYEATPLLSQAVSGTSWKQYTVNVSTTSSTVRLKIQDASPSNSTNYNMIIDDAQICLGPDATPPAVTFNPLNSTTGVPLDSNLTITSNEKLYRYNPTTGALKVLNVGDAAFSNADTLATFLTLKKVSDNSNVPFTVNIDASGKVLTINPISDFSYNTQYKLSISNVADVNGNILAGTQYTQFTTKTPPTPIINVQEVSSNVAYTSGSNYNMGTVYGNTTITKTFRIINTGTDPLYISSSNLSDGTTFKKTLSPAATVNEGDTTFFTLTFTPSSLGTYTDQLTIVNNDLTNANFTINLQGARAQFVLPYTYQSGCAEPIVNGSELKQDYENLSDIPSQITLNNGVAINNDHFYTSYKVFSAEGNCMPSGSSALKIGQDANGLELNLVSCGQITLKWCSNGYRKVRITDESGNVYEKSPSFLPGYNCYTTTTVVNTPNPVKINIEFLGNDSSLLTTLYYLNVTPYDATIKSSGRNIVDFSTGIVGENVRIYDNVVLVTVPSATDLSKITPTVVKASPFATVTPGKGILQDFSAGAKTYIVTAQDGSTKTYTVSVDHEIDYGTLKYSDSIAIPVAMKENDKKIEIVEIKNTSCQVPVSGNGSNYTIYFLDATDLPASGYKISGPTTLCIGSTATYSISNAPSTNSPKYVWHISGADKGKFVVVGDTVSETLKIKAPNELASGSFNFSVSVEFSPSECLFLYGVDTISIKLTDQAPKPITGLQSNCVFNGLLTVTAKGASDATTYNWTFTPSVPIVSQSDSSIVLNLGAVNDDISATVTTQNGCGVTTDTSSYKLSYAKEETTWKGEVSTDWSDNGNWTDRVPRLCTNVIIPDVGNGVKYPIIGSGGGECHYITFEPGGAVFGLPRLTYTRAYVQIKLQRNKWYTLTAPLKNMFSGDYYFTANPRSYMRLFDAINPDHMGDTTAVGTWTSTFENLAVSLKPGMGYAFLVDTFAFHYPNAPTYEKTDYGFSFPRLTPGGQLVTSLVPFSGVSGRLLTDLAISLPRDSSIAYRFAMENSSNKLTNVKVSIKPGLNLIGNPLMTHLDFNALYNSNIGKISNKVKFWNGTTFTTYMTGAQISSSMNLDNTRIAPMQSFFVEGLKTDSLLIDLNNHFVTDETTKLRSAATNKKSILYIKSAYGSYTSSTAVAYNTQASNNYGDDDAFKLFSQYTAVPEVYTVADNRALDINQFGSLPYTTPVGIKTSVRGNIALTFTGAESFEDMDVTLINTKTGETQNLKSNSEYTLGFDGASTESYLFVEFKSSKSETSEALQSEYCNKCIQVYSDTKNSIYVYSTPTDKVKKIIIWEDTGKQLYKKEDLDTSTFKTSLDTRTQICIVRVTTEKNTYVVKVLMNKK